MEDGLLFAAYKLSAWEKVWAASKSPLTGKKTRDFLPFLIQFLADSYNPVFAAIVEIAGKHLRIVPDLDKAFVLVLQGLSCPPNFCAPDCCLASANISPTVRAFSGRG